MKGKWFRISIIIVLIIACAALLVAVWSIWDSDGATVSPQSVADEWNQRNREVTLLSSDGRSADTGSSTQTNYWHKGLVLFFDVTGRDGSTTLTPNLQVQEPVGDNWITVWTAGSAINSADTSIGYLFYPSGLSDAAELYTEGVDLTLGRTWRITVTHSDTDVITYSSSCSLIR